MEKLANDTFVAQTISEMRVLARRRRFWAGLLGAGFVIGLTGPFGTYHDLPMLVRTVYWTLITTTTFWLGYFVSLLVATGAEGRGFGVLASIGIGAVVASFPVTGWLAGIHVAVFSTSFWTEVLQLLPYVMVICLAVAVLTESIATDEIRPTLQTISTPEPAWLDQLPHHLGRDLISLQAQDHYVAVETELGRAMIRTTLNDAANSLGDYGIRLHRSWWVARRAVKAYQYRKGAPVVILQDGRKLPVGRTYRRLVKKLLR